VKYRDDLDRRVMAGEAGIQSGRAFAKAIDGLMSALLPCTQATLTKTGKWVDCSLAAVGSYGRGVLAPRSDVDVRIVVDRNVARAQEVSEALLYPLWDAGLHVGHQVMDVEGALSLAREDLATATSLLDLRTVGGDAKRVEGLVKRALDGFFTAEFGRFIGRLREEQAGRHERYGGSLYLLEPDVKSGAGGLRDLDLARWAARARYHVGEAWQLVQIGVLVPREAEELTAAESFLWNVRARLHVRAGRRSDRITFDAQEELGKSLEGGLEGEPDAIAAERFMQRYYGHARTIARLVERVLDLCEPPRKTRASSPGDVLAQGVRTFDGHATLETPAQLAQDPALAIRLYHAAMRKGLGVYPYARDAVARVCHDPEFGEALRASSEARRLFLECLVSAAERVVPTKHGTPAKGSILRELHDVGLMLAMVPEFQPVVGRVHHDIYHVYTVDVHSVAAVDRLRALQRGELASEHALACRLAGDVARPVPLYVAILLHDVGKGQGGAGHSERGAEQCKPICARLGLSAEDTAEVAWLIREHLTMYHVATRRDLEDPGTVASFAQTIRGGGGSPIERLQKLYLLTVADISTTSPTAMTSWKARMLDDLFLATSHHLASEQRSLESPDQVVARVRASAALAWPNGKGDPFLDAFVAGMPKFYLVAHEGPVVAAHAAIARRRGAAPAIVGLAPKKHPDAMTLCVVAADRPGLLAKIAAALAANRLEILTAHIFVRPLSLGELGGSEIEAVDLFDVRRSAREGDEASAPLGEKERARLEADLQSLLRGDVDPQKLLEERRGGGTFRERPSPAVETEIEIDDRASRRFTVIDVYAKDRPGLLFTIANALHGLGLSIARSKIATEGARAADSFYVTEFDGTKVGSPSRYDEIKRSVAAAIERLAREGLA
jgi:[protein-PII] uridylyltransferase